MTQANNTPAAPAQQLTPELAQQLQQALQNQQHNSPPGAQAGATPELRDIHLPGDINWWPPAIGWWIVLAMLIAILISTYHWVKKRHANKPEPRINWRPALQAELQEIEEQFHTEDNQQQLAQQLSQLLRKAVVKESNEVNGVAGLTGKQWLNALDQHFQMSSPECFSEKGIALIEAPYNPSINFDADQLLALTNKALQSPLITNKQEATHD